MMTIMIIIIVSMLVMTVPRRTVACTRSTERHSILYKTDVKKKKKKKSREREVWEKVECGLLVPK